MPDSKTPVAVEGQPLSTEDLTALLRQAKLHLDAALVHTDEVTTASAARLSARRSLAASNGACDTSCGGGGGGGSGCIGRVRPELREELE